MTCFNARGVLNLCLLITALVTVPKALADTYSVRVAGGNFEPYALDDYGDYILNLGEAYERYQCDFAQSGGCYQIYNAATNTTTYTTQVPSPLPTDPNPIAGSGCTTETNGFNSVCYNGHQFFISNGAPRKGLFSGASYDDLIFSGSVDGPPLMSPSGNLLYIDGEADEIILVLDLTTLPAPPTSVTPEPSSFALLGTGLLGVAGVLRRRLV